MVGGSHVTAALLQSPAIVLRTEVGMGVKNCLNLTKIALLPVFSALVEDVTMFCFVLYYFWPHFAINPEFSSKR